MVNRRGLLSFILSRLTHLWPCTAQWKWAREQTQLAYHICCYCRRTKSCARESRFPPLYENLRPSLMAWPNSYGTERFQALAVSSRSNPLASIGVSKRRISTGVGRGTWESTGVECGRCREVAGKQSIEVGKITCILLGLVAIVLLGCIGFIVTSGGAAFVSCKILYREMAVRM